MKATQYENTGNTITNHKTKYHTKWQHQIQK